MTLTVSAFVLSIPGHGRLFSHEFPAGMVALGFRFNSGHGRAEVLGLHDPEAADLQAWDMVVVREGERPLNADVTNWQYLGEQRWPAGEVDHVFGNPVQTPKKRIKKAAPVDHEATK